MPENLRDLMVGPPPLATLPNHQDRRIDHTIFKPAQKRPLAHRQQSGHCSIRQPVSSGQVRNHLYHADHSIIPTRQQRFGDKNSNYRF